MYIFQQLLWQMGCNKTFAADFKALTMSYEELTGYNTWPKKSSATMQPRDHMSIADVRGSPRMTSGDLREENKMTMHSFVFTN